MGPVLGDGLWRSQKKQQKAIWLGIVQYLKARSIEWLGHIFREGGKRKYFLRQCLG